MDGSDLCYCRGCSHLTEMDCGLSHCNYIIDTGKRRGCDAGIDCPHHTRLNKDKLRRNRSKFVFSEKVHKSPKRLEIGGVAEREVEASCRLVLDPPLLKEREV